MFSEEIKLLIKKGLLRVIRDRNPHLRPGGEYQDIENFGQENVIPYGSSHIFIEGSEFINFSSNDYLGISCNHEIMQSAKDAIDVYGFGSGASRLLSGGTDLNIKLENMISEFKGTESSLVFNSGYTANISAIPSIAGENDVIFTDELNHASIIDGCRLSRAKKVIYNHADMNHLSELVKKEAGKRKIIITDTVFSMDGDIAPLKEIHAISMQNEAILYLDDAHGTGVLGNGYGALHQFGISPAPWIIQMGTFSKALGSFGAFIATSKEIVQWLTNKGRGLIFSTALPACAIAASIKALEIILEDSILLKNLWENRKRLFNGMNELGFDTLKSETPIIPLVPPPHFSDDAIENANLFSEFLKRNHIYAPAIRPPTVKIPRLRFSVIASHTTQDIDMLLNILSDLRSNPDKFKNKGI